MKHFLQRILMPLFLIFLGLQMNGQSAGFNSSFAVLSINGGSNAFYDLQAATGNPDFNGANLGNFNASNSLLLKGAEHNVFKCGGCDLTSTRIYYRVYVTGSTPGAFSNLNIGFASGGGNGCGGEDQQWANTGYTTNMLSGLIPGNYTFEVYSDATVTCLGGTVFAGNLGANYKATFNFCGPSTGALPVGNYAIPGCFATVASAVTYLNNNGVTGAGTVQFNVAAGHTETAPSTGIILNGLGTAGNLTTGTATTAIVFKKSGAGTNPTITAPLWAAGGTTDGIIKIIGGDYITFDGFTIQENPANIVVATGATNTMSELGIGMFLASATNGAQNNTIQNCTITLNNNFPNSVGIFSTSSSSSTNSALAATASTGTNSNNKIYANSISNVAFGFYAVCEPITAIINESGWDIGGSALATGNTITYGNAVSATIGFTRFSTSSAGGIVFRNGAGVNVRYNSVTSNSLAYGQSNFGGILVSNGSVPAGVTYSSSISNNTITITNNGTVATTAIDFAYGIATGTLTASDNIISIVGGSATTGGAIQGIKANYTSNSATYSNNSITMNQSGSGTFSGTVFFINADGATNDLTVQNNILQTTGSHLKTTGQFYGISHNASIANSVTIGNTLGTGNTINITRTGSGALAVYGIYSASNSPTTSYNVNYNSITLAGIIGTSQVFGINNTDGGATTNRNFNNNTINLTSSSSGVTNGMFLSKGNITASNNSVTIATAATSVAGIDFSSTGTVASGLADNNTFAISSSGISPTIRGINTSATTVTNAITVTNNTVNSISSTAVSGNPTLHGVRVSAGTNNVISGNTIKDFTTGASSGNAQMSGITIFGGTTPKVFRNNINNILSSCSGSFSTVSGISIAAGSTTYDIYNNIISDLRAPSVSANTGVVGIACFSSISTYRIYYNTIKLGTASPISGGVDFGATGVAVNGNSATTILDLRNNIINLNVTPSGTGFASCVAFSSGTANVLPLGFASTSNNNIYTINSGPNNYLFAQGSSTASPIVNGYAVSGLTPNLTNNINNDTNFNATCGLYKTFMGATRETVTYTENNLVAGSPTGVFAPSGTSFAENGAQVITTPSITKDFNLVDRTPTNDIGAMQFSGTAILYTNPSVTPTFTAVAAICSGESLSTLPTTSNNGITGTWSPALDNTATTTYTFTPDAGQCATTTTLNIVVYPKPTVVSSAGTIACFGGSTTVTVTASGGTPPYSGDGPQTVSAGPYSFTVTDANGCTAVTTGNVSEPSAVSASSTAGPIACNGGTTTVTVSATGGTAPYIGTGSQTVSAGPYSFTVTDANGCTAVTTGNVSEPSAVSASSTAGSIACNGGTTTVMVSATGGTAPYSGTGTFTVSAGAYSYTVTDANGCTSTTSGSVSEPAALVASNTAGMIACNGGTTTVMVSAIGGTAPYSGTGTFTVSSGAYSYTVTDANGCTSTTSGSVSQPSAVSASSTAGTISCNGGTTTVVVSATGGTAPYTGTGPQTVSAGPYSFTVTDANGCVAVTTGNVSQPSAVSASSSAGTISCNGGTTTVVVSATGGTAPYTGTGPQTVSAGPYSFTVTDANGCTSVTTGSVSQPIALVASSTAGTIVCNGGSTTVTVSATGGTAPYTGTGTFTSTGGAYSYLVTDANGCTSITTGAVVNPAALTTTTTVSSPTAYLWPVSGLTYASSGTYLFNTVNGSGCTVVNTLLLTIGTSTTVTTFTIPTTCGATISSLAVTINTAFIVGATTYRFRITNLTTSAVQTLDRPVNSFALSGLPGTTFGTAYQVEVAVKIGTGSFGAFGTPCLVNTPSPVSTIGAQCGTTLTSMSQSVFCTFVSGITGYRFRVTNTVTSAVQITDQGLNRFNFNQLVNRSFNTVYLVEVALKNTDGTYLPYSQGCTITTPTFPTSEIRLSQCDYTALSNTESFVATLVSGATEYRFLVYNTGLGYSFSIDRPVNTMNLNMFPGLLAGTTYSVQVAVKIGGVFGPYGKVCNVTTPGGTRMATPAKVEFKAIAFPNPFAEDFMLDVKTSIESTIQIKVYNMLGKLIENKNVEVSEIENLQIGSNYPSGVYNVIVSQGENTQTIRVIKR